MSLLRPDQLKRRLDALDLLDAHSAPQPEFLGPDATMFNQRVMKLSSMLEAVNETLYAAIRAEIQLGNREAVLLQWVPSSTAVPSERRSVAGMGYDFLDELIRGVFAFEEPSSYLASNHPEMVFYQPTPARHIFRLIELAALTSADVLVDLGSGLGHVPLLVSICTSARCIGIELEASYVACGRQCAQQLHLRGVSFIHQDARSADFSTGTVFYLHTPFTGSIMRSVLGRLRHEAAGRTIRVCTYGPCTAVIAEEPWLEAETATETNQISMFKSCV